MSTATMRLMLRGVRWEIAQGGGDVRRLEAMHARLVDALQSVCAHG